VAVNAIYILLGLRPPSRIEAAVWRRSLSSMLLHRKAENPSQGFFTQAQTTEITNLIGTKQAPQISVLQVIPALDVYLSYTEARYRAIIQQGNSSKSEEIRGRILTCSKRVRALREALVSSL